MNNAKCFIPGHGQSNIICFCYQQNCKMPTRLLCDLCIHEHHRHLITTLNTKFQKTPIQNLRANFSESQNHPQSRSNINSYLSNILDKCAMIFTKIDKFKQHCFKDHLLFMAQIISNSFEQNAGTIGVTKIINQNIEEHHLMAKAIRCFQKEHLKNISLLQASAKCMENQLSKAIDTNFQAIEKAINKIQLQVNQWSLFEVVDYKEKIIVQDFQKIDIKTFKDRQTKLQQLKKLAQQKGYFPIINYLQRGHTLQTINQLKMIGKNLKQSQKFTSTIKQSIIEIQGINSLINLKKLELSYNKITKISNISNLTQLLSLRLNSNNITKIQGLQYLNNLRLLDLGDNFIRKIQNLENNTSLRVLILNNNQIAKIQNLQKLLCLRFIQLDHNLINKIQNLSTFTKTSLGLSYNKIKKIQNLQMLNPLNEYLNLYGNPIIRCKKNKMQAKSLRKRIKECYLPL